VDLGKPRELPMTHPLPSRHRHVRVAGPKQNLRIRDAAAICKDCLPAGKSPCAQRWAVQPYRGR
jgi:hypothetical protein